jgi:DNA-binding winged helix-turn-helix (wHTH) protein
MNGSNTLKTQVIYQFGDVQVNPVNRTLHRNGVLVPINRRAFDVLIYLMTSPGRVVTKEELLKSVWSDALVDENNLNQSISALRKALDERPGENASITTLPGRGYQFVRQVETIATEPAADALPEQQTHAGHRIAGEARHTSHGKYVLVLGALTVVSVASVAGYLAWRRSHSRPGSATVVVASFLNTTGDATFDRTLDRALQIDLGQSPYMDVMSASEVVSVLGFMGRPADSTLTADLARQICERTNRHAVLSGSIARLENRYDLTLQATGCSTGKELATAKAEASTKEGVLAAVDSLADRVRSKLGESAESRETYEVPLATATTPSLDALKAYSMASYLGSLGRDETETLPYLQKAVDLDPGFSMAWGAMANNYYNQAEFDKASADFKKAFDLRGNLSAREKLTIEAHYYAEGQHDIEGGIRTYKVWAGTYPNDWVPVVNLCNQYTQIGQYPPAIEYGKRALQMQPDRGITYSVLARALTRANRFAEATAVGAQAMQRGKDSVGLHATLYGIAFLEKDQAAVQHETAWAAAHNTGWYKWFFPAEVAAADASMGKFQEAEAVFRKSVDAAHEEKANESADAVLADQARMELDFGFPAAARATLQRISNQQTDVPDLAVVYAELGDIAPAQRYLSTFGSANSDTEMIGKSLPRVRSALAIAQGRPFEAVAALEPGRRYELYNYDVLAQRGAAYLQAKDGPMAAGEYKRILANPGLDPGRWTWPMAHLGLARAYALAGDTPASRNEYAALFAAFKDADTGLPFLRDARYELASLPAPTRR